MAATQLNDWTIEPLSKRHDRSGFDCGKSQLDEFLKTQATQYQKKNLARTFVATPRESAAAAGYYSLSAGRVEYEDLPDKAVKGLRPTAKIGVVLLARLAVDRRAQGRGLGKLLLIDALRRSLVAAESIGVRAIEVDAIDDKACAFYKRYGFVSLKDDTRHMYLPMATVKKLGLPPVRG